MPVPIEYGDNVVFEELRDKEQWLVFGAEPLRAFLEQHATPVSFWFPGDRDTDERLLAAWERTLPPAEGILGVGGGVCMDAAKYMAWRRDLPLVLAPSIVSVDACLTETIAVRREGRVRYVGEVYPQKVIVDYGLIRTAPAHLNRAGAGDLLSIHTALWDWTLAAQRTGESHDPEIANESAKLLARLEDAAEEIRAVSEAGIRALIELYAAEVDLCRRAGSSRPEEGSEHFWAYNVEYRTRRAYVHGELVALGVLLMAALQENAPNHARVLVDKLGVRWRPESIGLSRQQVIGSLVSARDYAQEERLAFSVINERPLSTESARELVRRVCD